MNSEKVIESLKRLLNNGKITQEEYDAAIAKIQ